MARDLSASVSWLARIVAHRLIEDPPPVKRHKGTTDLICPCEGDEDLARTKPGSCVLEPSIYHTAVVPK
jgi:hypothetical protein